MASIKVNPNLIVGPLDGAHIVLDWARFLRWVPETHLCDSVARTYTYIYMLLFPALLACDFHNFLFYFFTFDRNILLIFS